MTQDKHTFAVQSRTIFGKQSKQLRNQGLLVGSVSIPNQDSLHVQVDYRTFVALIDKVGESGLFYITVDDKKTELPVLIDELQTHPLTQELLHVTFRKVDLNETVESEIPVEFIGEPEAKNGVLVTVKDTIEIEALPTDLPESFEVDLSAITEIDQSITLADLSYDSTKIKFVLSEDQSLEDVTLVVYQAQAEEEEENSDDEQSEPEITGGAGSNEAAEAAESAE